MKVYGLMVRNEELKIDWYLNSVWMEKDKVEDFIKQMKNLDDQESNWEYKIQTTVMYK